MNKFENNARIITLCRFPLHGFRITINKIEILAKLLIYQVSLI